MTNAELIARDTAHLIHPLHDARAQRTARVWVKGEGALLWDADGHEYIDGLAGLWNVLAGHGRRARIMAVVGHVTNLRRAVLCSDFVAAWLDTNRTKRRGRTAIFGMENAGRWSLVRASSDGLLEGDAERVDAPASGGRAPENGRQLASNIVEDIRTEKQDKLI